MQKLKKIRDFPQTLSLRRRVFWAVAMLAWCLLLWSATLFLQEHSEFKSPYLCGSMLLLTGLYVTAVTVVTIFGGKKHFGGWKTGKKLHLIFTITATLICFELVGTEQLVAGTVAQVTMSDSSTANQGSAIAAPKCCGWIFVLLIGALLFYLLWKFCKAAGFCGNQPPQHQPANGNELVKHSASNATTSAEKIFILYLDGDGNVVSNSADMHFTKAPSLLCLAGVPIPNGAEVDTDADSLHGIINVFTLTNSIADADLDPNHPYTTIINCSILSKTNLAEEFTTFQTHMVWVNNNPTTPLSCMVTYTNNVTLTANGYVTNGVAIGTNWIQASIGPNGYPTTITIRGNVEVITNGYSATDSQRYFQLWASTNTYPVSTGP